MRFIIVIGKLVLLLYVYSFKKFAFIVLKENCRTFIYLENFESLVKYKEGKKFINLLFRGNRC